MGLPYLVYCFYPSSQQHICIVKITCCQSSETIENLKMQDMFTGISWSDYTTTTALLLAAYYLFVGVKFYSRELQYLLSSKSRFLVGSTSVKSNVQNAEESNLQLQAIQSVLFPSSANYTPVTETIEDIFKQVQELTGKLEEAIAVAAEKGYIKDEFVLSLQLLLKNYAFLKGSLAMGAINNLIASECERYGYIQLSAEERVMLWNE